MTLLYILVGAVLALGGAVLGWWARGRQQFEDKMGLPPGIGFTTIEPDEKWVDRDQKVPLSRG